MGFLPPSLPKTGSSVCAPAIRTPSWPTSYPPARIAAYASWPRPPADSAQSQSVLRR
jgi:hypothetical protein